MDAKEKHGMRYTKLRGLAKIEMEGSLIFSCMNLKKLANWRWKNTFGLDGYMPNFEYFSMLLINNIKMASFTCIKDAICLQTEVS